MSIGGGGGGGPVGVSNSFTGPAEALEVVGDFAYALSGTFQSLDASQTMLDFQTGNFTFVGTIYCNGAVDVAQPDSGVVSAFTLEMNGATIALLKSETGSERQYSAWNDVIIPPYTQFTVKVIASGSNAAFLNTAVMTGRIYRG